VVEVAAKMQAEIAPRVAETGDGGPEEGLVAVGKDLVPEAGQIAVVDIGEGGKHGMKIQKRVIGFPKMYFGFVAARC
jgi:hypothetical protein